MVRYLRILPLAALVAACATNTHVATTPMPDREEGATPVRTAPATGSTAVTLGIPPGHLPRPGRCRLWLPGTPPGHQPAARPCNGIDVRAPVGSMIVYRPDETIVQVRYVDAQHPGVVIAVRVFDAATGVFLRAEG
jgi:hypothetical protein